MELAGKVVVITGAASGVGAASAKCFAAEGATVVLTDIDGAGLARVAGELGAVFHAGDIARGATTQAVADLA